MLPFPRIGGAHLSRIAAYMGLALHEIPEGYALLKLSDASSCVISLTLIFCDKRFSKLTLFMKIHLSISHLLHANPTFSKVVHFGWGQHLCEYQIIEKRIKSEKKPLMCN